MEEILPEREQSSMIDEDLVSITESEILLWCGIFLFLHFLDMNICQVNTIFKPLRSSNEIGDSKGSSFIFQYPL